MTRPLSVVRPPAPVPSAAAARLRSPRAGAGWLPLAGAPIALWSVRALDVTHLGQYGLPPVLPVTWYAALAVLTLSAGVTLAARQFDQRRAAANLVALVAVLYGTVAVAARVPRYSWVYKHVGVVRYIELHGSVDWSVDIYHRWPGFFAVGAFASWVSGQPDPTAWVGWAEPVFSLLSAFLVAATVGAITGRSRAGWGAATIYATGNWVGQAYFSPQAFGYLLTLAIYAVLLRHLRRPNLSRPGTIAEHWAIVAARGSVDETQIVPRQLPVWRPVPAVVIVLGLFAAIVVSHQLTPYMTVFGVGALVLLGGVRPWWLPLAMLLMAVAYLAPHLGYIQDNFGIFSSLDPFANAHQLSEYETRPLPGLRLNKYAGTANAGMVLGLSVWGGVTMLRRRLARQAVLLVVLAAAPGVLLLGQNYGGEASLRVVLFALPWAGGLAFAALDPWLAGGSRRRLRLLLRQPIALVLLVALFVPAYFGKDELNDLPVGEVVAANWFYANGEPGSVLMLAAPDFPLRVGARYDQFGGPKSDDDPNLLAMKVFRDRPPLGSPGDVDLAVTLLRRYSSKGYLVFTDTSARYAHVYGLVPDDALAGLERAVAVSGRFHLVYRNDNARIYRLTL